MEKYKKTIIDAAHHVLHKIGKTEFFVHCFYCGTVFVSAHGVYSVAAGVLGVVMLVNHFVGEG